MQSQARELIDKIKELINPCITSHGLELVEINYFYQANKLILRIFIDRPEGGINIDECALVNQELGSILDAAGLIQQSYTLEVSSPGVDRVLKTWDDFKRVINRNLVVFLNESIKGKHEIHGILKRVDSTFIYIESGEQEFLIPYTKITRAKQVIE
ncbi:MAG: ribosome maturation factor RimP [Candidatus Omnitrophica bacterium]|nr:ribosome maturation factor RimP [Candidatus Omnitrophota bacterium]